MIEMSADQPKHRKTPDVAKKIAPLFMAQKNIDEMRSFLEDILTKSEMKDILERWQIVKALLENDTQRDVKKKLGVSISKVSRGSQTVQYGSGAFQRTAKRLKKST